MESTPPALTVSNASRTVLVTGGSGYIGSWAILTLLQQGYRVRTTVRTPGRAGVVRDGLAKHTTVDDRLSFATADLGDDAGWGQAVEGCDAVLHVASPIGREAMRADIVATTHEGTLRVLKASVEAGVKRVVLTSSGVAAQPPRQRDKNTPNAPADEQIWTDLTRTDIDNYTRAKTLAERAAWDFMATNGGATTFASVLPVFVQGPVLSKDLASDSTEVGARLLAGRLPGLPRLGFAMVDVRDVVDLHLRAMTHPNAAGHRFVASSDFLWMADIARILRTHLGERAAKVPARLLPNIVIRASALFNQESRFLVPRLDRKQEFTSAKARDMLGWRPRPVVATIVNGSESLFHEGLVHR